MIILRILKKIREGKLDPKNVSVLYVDPIDDSESQILELRIDENGEFQYVDQRSTTHNDWEWITQCHKNLRATIALYATPICPRLH